MGEIPWSKVLEAVNRRDVRRLENLAARTRHEERRKLLLLFSDIVGSGLPTRTLGALALPRIVAKLTYDSFRDPLVVGVRSEGSGIRQALYEAGRYCVDLRLERERRSGLVTIIGQIADREQPEASPGHVPVVLLSGKAVIARAHSNLLGEFQMEYVPTSNLRLYLPVEQRGQGIEVPLSKLEI